MTPLRHSAATGTEKWPKTPEIWSGAVLAKGRTMVSLRQRLPVIVLTIALLLLAIAIGTYEYSKTAPLGGVEVAVLFPSTDTSDWQDFVQAIHLAAQEKGFQVRDDHASFTSIVDTAGQPITFRWYPFIGSYRMQKIVRELCQRKNPPIAIVGASNSSLTRAIGDEIQASSTKESAPVLLMTFATSDSLIDINSGRSFRFGFSNSHQARAVVDRLKTLLAESQSSTNEPMPNVIVTQVLDNPFSIDLARQFERELLSELNGVILPPVAPFDQGNRYGGMSAAWSLTTATTEQGDPTSEERTLAKEVVHAFARQPEAPAILVLPVGSDAFVNIAGEIRTEMRRLEMQTGKSPIHSLTIVTGDSVDYYEFAGDGSGPITARQLPGRVLFFSHVNPVDRTIHPTPNFHCPTIGLDREVARALIEVIPTLKNPPDSEELMKGLAGTKRRENPIFKDRERALGGGVVIVKPDVVHDRIEFIMPDAWVKAK